MSDTPPPAPAGWYPDPNGSGAQRYWDGTAWGPSAPEAPASGSAAPGPTGAVVAVAAAAVIAGEVSPKSRLAALLLAIFLGAFGVHSFYVGKVGAGIGQIAITVCTLGIFSWVWPLIDVILIAVGTYKDGQGRLVLIWET